MEHEAESNSRPSISDQTDRPMLNEPARSSGAGIGWEKSIKDCIDTPFPSMHELQPYEMVETTFDSKIDLEQMHNIYTSIPSTIPNHSVRLTGVPILVDGRIPGSFLYSANGMVGLGKALEQSWYFGNRKLLDWRMYSIADLSSDPSAFRSHMHAVAANYLPSMRSPAVRFQNRHHEPQSQWHHGMLLCVVLERNDLHDFDFDFDDIYEMKNYEYITGPEDPDNDDPDDILYETAILSESSRPPRYILVPDDLLKPVISRSLRVLPGHLRVENPREFMRAIARSYEILSGYELARFAGRHNLCANSFAPHQVRLELEGQRCIISFAGVDEAFTFDVPAHLDPRAVCALLESLIRDTLICHFNYAV